jgi:hypothetical protein
MAKIDSYPLADSPISGSDKMIGTDTVNNNATKNFTVSELASFVNAGSGFVPYTGATENVNLGSQVLYATGGIFYGTIQATNINAIGGLLINSNAGTSGQVLVSQGTGTPPIWSSSVVAGPQGVQGPIGPQGVAGPVGPAGLNWQSSWVSGTSYIADDAVGYGGASWFCILATSGTTTPDLDTTHWALLASQGAQGPAGATGAQGPTGATGATGATGVSGNNTLQQVLDLNHNLVDAKNYQGTFAGSGNTGININAFGAGAAQGNTGDDINALGYQAGLSNTGFYVNAIGPYSASSNSGWNVNAIGYSAAISNSGFNVNALGSDAGNLNAYSYVNLFGYNASATSNNQTVLAGQNFMARLGYGGITTNRLYTFPDKNGTFAMLSDLTGGAWFTTGNAGTTSGVNFIGTTDAVDLVFKTNNTQAVIIGSAGDVTMLNNLIVVKSSGNSISCTDGIYSYASLINDPNTADGGYLFLQNNIGVASSLKATNLTSARTHQLPDESGTLALTSDIVLPYKVYSAIVQYAAAPSVAVLQNTLGATISWTDQAFGASAIASSSVFTINKTVIIATPYTNPGSTLLYNNIGVRSSGNQIDLLSKVTANAGTGKTNGVPFFVEIRVYP